MNTFTHIGVRKPDKELAHNLAKRDGVVLAELLHRALSEYAASRDGVLIDVDPTPGELTARLSRLQESIERRLSAIEEALGVLPPILGTHEEKVQDQ